MRVQRGSMEGIEARMQAIENRMNQKFGPRQRARAEEATPSFGSGSDAQGMQGLSGAIGGVATLRPMSLDGFNLSSTVPGDLSQMIQRIAEQESMDPKLIEAVIEQESAFNPRAVSPAGAQGLMQLMPPTAKSLGVTDPFDPEQNIRAGTRYLRQLVQQFDRLDVALAAYNAGPGNVQRHGGIPPFAETQNYVKKILSRYQPGGMNIGQ